MKIKVYVPKVNPVEGVNISGVIHAVLKKFMNVAKREARLNVSGGGRAKDKLNVRSGALRRSIYATVERGKSVIVFSRSTTTRGTLGTNIIYGRIHEEGGVIRPVTKQYLTIPLKHVTDKGRVTKYSALTNAGVQRWGAGNLGAARTFVQKSKSGNLFIFAKIGKNKIIPIFRLVREVKIPKRPYLQPAMEKIVGPVMEEIGTRITK